MKQTLNKSQFHDAFRSANRQNQFSYEGLNALFDWLEQLEQDLGEEIELDVIELCCNFSEISIDEIEGETGCRSLSELRDKTNVIEIDDETLIYEVF